MRNSQSGVHRVKAAWIGLTATLSRRRLFLAALSMTLLMAVSPAMGKNADTPRSPLSVHLAPEETAVLQRHPRPRIGVWVSAAPYAFPDASGRPQGIFIDILREVEARIPIRFHVVSSPSFAAAWEQASAGTLDMLVAVTPSEKHQAAMNLTTVYHVVPIVLVTESGHRFVTALKDFSGKKVVVNKGHVTEQWIRRDYPDISLVLVDSYEAGLRRVSEGKADAYAGAMAVLTYEIRKHRITNLKIAAKTPYSYQLCLAVRKDWPELAPIFDKALAAIGDDTKEAIYNRWVGVPVDRGVDWSFFWKVLGGVIAAAAMIFLAILVWNRRLQNEIARRDKVEAALKERERQTATLIGNLPGIAYRCRNDPGWTMIYISGGCESLTGYAASELTDNAALAYGDLILPDDRHYVWEEIQQAISENRSFTLEYRILDKQGQERWVWEKGVAVKTAEKGRVLLEGFITDITDRKKAEADLKTSQALLRQAHKMEAIGTLAGGVAHEFNNILEVVLGNAELALEDVPETSEAYEFLEEVRTASLRARDVVRQLMSFSRMHSQRYEPLDLVGVMRDAEGLLCTSLPENIHFNMTLPETCHRVMGDQTQIQQILLNLCTNAAQAMAKDGGTLSVLLDNVTLQEPLRSFDQAISPGDFVRLTVSDSGEGIPEEYVERVFDPFFTTREVDQGAGLGLAAVHGIVKQHGGLITLKSRTGEGTTVACYLPAVSTAHEIAPAGGQPLMYGTESILFVDDEPALLRLGQRRLERLGYTIHTESDPQRALDLFASMPEGFDLVITDMGMPHLTGDRLVASLKKLRPDVKTIICTGHATKMNGLAAPPVGADKVLLKPVDMEVLARAVGEVLHGVRRGCRREPPHCGKRPV